MRFDGNFGSEVNYEPNSMGGPKQDERFRDRPMPLSGEPAARYDHREGNDDYTQAGNLYRLMDEGGKKPVDACHRTEFGANAGTHPATATVSLP